MSTGTVNMASANITGGTINIETANETDDHISFSYETPTVAGSKTVYEFEVSTETLLITKKKYLMDTLMESDSFRVRAEGVLYQHNSGLSSRWPMVSIDRLGVAVSYGAQSVEVSPTDGITVTGSSGEYAILTSSSISFYDRNDNLIKSL